MEVDVKNLGEKKLEALIEEATVDCYSDEEAAMGLFTMLQDNLIVPFTAHVLEMPVKVTAIELNDAEEAVAVCERDGKRQRVPVVDLPLPTPPPKGSEWIEAYRYWKNGR
jgi:hypothetical protein